MEKVDYRGWKSCYRLANELVELVVTGDVGPRIIRFGFVGGPNEFWENERWVGRVAGEEWVNYGGHRLWHAPEREPRTYAPDNAPVQVEEHGDFVRFSQPVETSTGIQKELDIRLVAGVPRVEVTHRLRNENPWAVEMAPWALSVMAAGGTAVLPLPPRGAHDENLAPTSALVLWAYTDMSDPRWHWGRRFVLLRQDVEIEGVQKVGASVPDGWVAYAREGHLFVKSFEYVAGARYPDFGASVELFTDAEMLEVETLAPLAQVAPGAAAEHVETWRLFANVTAPTNDAGVREGVLPHLEG